MTTSTHASQSPAGTATTRRDRGGRANVPPKLKAWAETVLPLQYLPRHAKHPGCFAMGVQIPEPESRLICGDRVFVANESVTFYVAHMLLRSTRASSPQLACPVFRNQARVVNGVLQLDRLGAEKQYNFRLRPADATQESLGEFELSSPIPADDLANLRRFSELHDQLWRGGVSRWRQVLPEACARVDSLPRYDFDTRMPVAYVSLPPDTAESILAKHWGSFCSSQRVLERFYLAVANGLPVRVPENGRYLGIRPVRTGSDAWQQRFIRYHQFAADNGRQFTIPLDVRARVLYEAGMRARRGDVLAYNVQRLSVHDTRQLARNWESSGSQPKSSGRQEDYQQLVQWHLDQWLSRAIVEYEGCYLLPYEMIASSVDMQEFGLDGDSVCWDVAEIANETDPSGYATLGFCSQPGGHAFRLTLPGEITISLTPQDRRYYRAQRPRKNA